MNERNGASPPANIGISLLLSVFLVLCLFTFSAIALVQSGNEWRQAVLTRDTRSAYYAASNNAEMDLNEINGDMPAKKKDIERQYELSDSQALSVVFSYDKSKDRYVFSEFQTISTETWEGDDSLNVIR